MFVRVDDTVSKTTIKGQYYSKWIQFGEANKEKGIY